MADNKELGGGEMKKYALVEIKDCPSKYEEKPNFFDEAVCCKNKAFEGEISCKNCYYGDTKEQLVRKVAQALELCMKKGYRTITTEEFAKFIVEFLGVK